MPSIGGSMLRSIFLLVILFSCLVLAQPKQTAASSSPKTETAPSLQFVPKAAYDSIQYRNQQDIEGLKRDLAAYKELSFKAMDTSSTHLNTFIVAVVTLLVIVGIFNFTASARERKNIQEALERQFEEKLKQEMQKIQVDYKGIKEHSQLLIATAEDDKKKLKAELESFGREEVRKAVSDSLYEINDDLNSHKTSFEEEMILLHLTSMRISNLLRDTEQFIKSYEKFNTYHVNPDLQYADYGGQAIHLLFDLLRKENQISKANKGRIKNQIESTHFVPEQDKTLALHLLEELDEFGGIAELYDRNWKLKEILEEKRKRKNKSEGTA